MTEAWEPAFIRQGRGRGLGWQSLATMVGRSTLDIRRDYDPHYSRPYEPRRAPPTSAPSVRVATYRSGELSGAGRALRQLYHASIPLTKWDLGGAPGMQAVYRLRCKFGDHVVGSVRGVGYWITDPGRAVYEKYFASHCHGAEGAAAQVDSSA